jgi:D-alanyl-D-alanine dipeptidase
MANSGGDAFASSTQMIIVTTPGWDAVDGRMQRYQRSSAHKAWEPVGDSSAIVVGKRGMGWGAGVMAAANEGRSAADPVKQEGDGKSPAGVFRLGTAFGDAPEGLSGSKMKYMELTPSIECVDDVGSRYYNRLVDRSTVAAVDWKSSEHMRDTGEAYRWGIVVDHNGIAGPESKAPVRGGGSCIFLHLWQGAGHGTAGCTAMAPSEMEVLLRWLDPKRSPLLVQLTVGEYARVMKEWKLPAVVNLSAH